MSMSIFFEAKRNKPLTKQESALCFEIVERYGTEYPFKPNGKIYMVLPPDSQLGIVYSSFTKLPITHKQMIYEIANYWLKCFTEITYALQDCLCSVSFEGEDLILDSEIGWRFLTDEEYKQRYHI